MVSMFESEKKDPHHQMDFIHKRSKRTFVPILTLGFVLLLISLRSYSQRSNDAISNFTAVLNTPSGLAISKVESTSRNEIKIPGRAEEKKEKIKRDNGNDDHKKSKHKKKKTLLDSPWIRFLIAVGVFLVLNMIVICIHHVYMKLTSSEKSYRSVQQNISPF